MEGSEVGRYSPTTRPGAMTSIRAGYAHSDEVKLTTTRFDFMWPGAATGSGSGGDPRRRRHGARGEAESGSGQLPRCLTCVSRVLNSRAEEDFGKPERIMTALDIMTEGPLGGAAFNNVELAVRRRMATSARRRESDQPQWRRAARFLQMIGGGIGGNIRVGVRPEGRNHRWRQAVLGGPAMNIDRLGGGAASSMASGQSDADLDFASVQRDNRK